MSVRPPDDKMGGFAGWYAKRGFAVFPAWPVDGDRCACGNAQCKSPGKHPVASLAPHGVNDAMADPDYVREWWAGFPDANIGLATGDLSGVVVLDVDLPGLETIANLQSRYEPLPPTWTVETGSGGHHFYFRMPLADIRNSASAIGPGVDVRGNGGYVIVPPSNHISGERYRWIPEWAPNKVELAPMPEWLLKKVVPSGVRQRSEPLPAVLNEGMRNSWLASAAGAMRRKGFGQNAITAALRTENQERCRPPLDVREVDKIAWSIMRYEPAGGLATNG
jgi:putative DNA primase/helicase